MKKNYLKTALFALLLTGQINAQTDYVVESIPYQIYDSSTPLNAQIDDKYSEIITIPFDFVFFGETHNQLLINGNGFIDFRTELAGIPSGWQFNTTIPNANFSLKNVILGCYHDINSTVPGSLGMIATSVLGEAPYRKFTIGFSNMAHFSCNLAATSSFQMILHETYNYIDVQIAEKDLCTQWNNGNAVVGIVDATGAIAYTPPGRNTGAWEVTAGEGWRFRTDDIAATPENLLKNTISLYPNPSSDIVMAENNSGKDIADISMYSINGVRVKQIANNNTLNISDLQSGIYIVKVLIDNQSLNYKFIKK
jgi:hypothetical protein